MVRLGGGRADEHRGEHIQRRVPQFAQGEDDGLLPRPARVAGVPAHGIGAGPGVQQDVAGPLEVVRPLVGGGIIDHHGEVPRRPAAQAFFNDLPGGEQVGQGNHTEIVADGGPQQRPAGQRGRHAGHHLHLH